MRYTILQHLECLLDILEKVSKLQGSLGTEALSGPTRVKEELAIHADEIRSFFFDETKKLNQVIPQVLLVRMDFRKLEIHPRNIISFEESKLYETENAGLDPYAEVGDEEYGDEEYEEEEYEEEEYEEEEEEAAADDEELEPDPA